MVVGAGVVWATVVWAVVAWVMIVWPVIVWPMSVEPTVVGTIDLTHTEGVGLGVVDAGLGGIPQTAPDAVPRSDDASRPYSGQAPPPRVVMGGSQQWAGPASWG